MTKLTGEKIAEIRATAVAKRIADPRDVLSLLDALEAAQRDFTRLAYLGNLARSRTTEEQDELNALMRKSRT